MPRIRVFIDWWGAMAKCRASISCFQSRWARNCALWLDLCCVHLIRGVKRLFRFTQKRMRIDWRRVQFLWTLYVELPRHNAGKTLRWTPWVFGKDAAGQIVNNNNVAVGMIWQDCLDVNEWLDVSLTVVSDNGRPFCNLLYSIVICIVLKSSMELFILLSFSIQSEEGEKALSWITNIPQRW